MKPIFTDIANFEGSPSYVQNPLLYQSGPRSETRSLPFRSKWKTFQAHPHICRDHEHFLGSDPRGPCTHSAVPDASPGRSYSASRAGSGSPTSAGGPGCPASASGRPVQFGSDQLGAAKIFPAAGAEAGPQRVHAAEGGRASRRASRQGGHQDCGGEGGGDRRAAWRAWGWGCYATGLPPSPGIAPGSQRALPQVDKTDYALVERLKAEVTAGAPAWPCAPLA